MRHILLAAALLLPGPVFAHAILVDSSPAASASLPAGPATAVLRFNSRIDQARSRLVLHGTADRVLPLLPNAAPDTLSARIDLPAGLYALRWQVLATDGHITRGEVPFTVQAR